MSWSIDFQDIMYTDLKLNMNDVTFELTRMEEQFGTINMINKALEYWAISAV